jgi:hypothetical protein
VHREMDLGKSGIWRSKTQLWGVHYSGLRCGDTKQCTTSKQDRHKHSTKSMGVSKVDNKKSWLSCVMTLLHLLTDFPL